MKKTFKYCLLILSTLLISFLLFVFNVDFHSHTKLSPNNQYRAEVYYVNGFRRLLSVDKNLVAMNDAGYIEIYREKDGKLLDKSEVISLSGTGPSFWGKNPNSYQWGATWVSIKLK